MDLISACVRWFIAPAWSIWERSPYIIHYSRLLRSQYDRQEVIQQRQWKKVKELLNHAYRTVPFWKVRFEQAGITPDDIRSFNDFCRLPLTTKADLRASSQQLRSANYPTWELHHKKTSGSTGVSVEVVVNDAAQQFKRACTLRSDEWSGWRLGERTALLWGAEENPRRGWRPWLRNTLLERVTRLDTLRINEESMGWFIATLRRRPPGLLLGHAHSLYLLAQFVRNHSQLSFRPHAIISTAMVLHDWERHTIEEVFQCPVTNRYGCEEVGLIACECEQHNGLHINADGIYVEVLRANGTTAEPGETGMIVLTDLANRAMPIIRYQVGDMGVLSERSCPCGRGLPLLEKIEGRIADYVITPRGEYVSGISLTDHFNTLIPGVIQLQIVQEEVDHFLFRIVKGPDFGEHSLVTIQSLVAKRFGPDVRFKCEYVDRIPQESSGKYRFCISKVQKSDLGNYLCGMGKNVS
jgi:phenylacetate-CoA ligase